MADERQQAVIGGLRTQLGQALDSVTADKLEQLVGGIFDQTKARWAYCDGCKRKATPAFRSKRHRKGRSGVVPDVSRRPRTLAAGLVLIGALVSVLGAPS